MSGFVRVVGLGPGPHAWITPEVKALLAEATDLVGYHTYLERVRALPAQTVHASDNGDELARARLALALARQGRRAVVVSGGDPGVFGMAAAVCEALDEAREDARSIDVAVVPGVTAMLAAAARFGAPLGNDFCAINLSDNLKPFAVIERRLRLAAQADFVIALYNPASRARPEQIKRAFALLREERALSTLVMLAKAVGRPDEELTVTTLGEVRPEAADMRTLVIVGARGTRAMERPGKVPLVYTSRRIDEAP